MTARLALLVACLVPIIGVAAPERDLAQVCAGKPAHDDLMTCGNYWFDSYNRNPHAPGGDERLYNAGAMLADAGAISAAITAFTMLRTYFPASKLGGRALVRIGMLHAQVAMYDRAAAAFEEYASKYAGEKDAGDALNDAIHYRAVIGDDARAIEDTKLFEKIFGAKQRGKAAAAAFSLTAIYEKQNDREATRKHLESYIRTYGRSGGVDQVVIAYAKLGQLLWDDSCPVKPIDGVCAKLKHAGHAAVCDGASSAVALEPVKRDDAKVKAALAAFSQAAKAYEATTGSASTAPASSAASAWYYARARLAQVDAEAEARLTRAAPAGAKLARWIEDERSSRQQLAEKYERIVQLADPATAIDAVARTARLHDRLASAITESATKADCTTVAAKAEPSRALAIHGYEACLAKSRELDWFDDEGGRTCERALVRLAKDRYPPLREITATATFMAPLLVVTGL